MTATTSELTVPTTCKRCGDRVRWNGQKWTTVDAPAEPCLPGLGADHVPE